MRTRKHDWFDSRGYKPKYGFQVLINGRWKHAAEDGKPCLFDTPEERDSKQAEFRKMATPSNASFSREPERSGGESAGSDSYGGTDD